MNEAKTKSAMLSACSVRMSAELSMVDDAECPTVSKLKTSGKLSGDTNDPWGHELHISCASDEITVTSDGPDGKPGTSDDVRGSKEACKR
jgi:hypothetical protein